MKYRYIIYDTKNNFLEFEKIYEKLNISIIERGESFYQNHMEKLVEELEAKGKILMLNSLKTCMYYVIIYGRIFGE